MPRPRAVPDACAPRCSTRRRRLRSRRPAESVPCRAGGRRGKPSKLSRTSHQRNRLKSRGASSCTGLHSPHRGRQDPAGMGEYAKLAGRQRWRARRSCRSTGRHQVLEGSGTAARPSLAGVRVGGSGPRMDCQRTTRRRSSCDSPPPTATVPSFPVSAGSRSIAGTSL